MFDLSGFYFHDDLVKTNGVDDPVKQRADQRIRLSQNIRYFPSRVEGIRSQFLKLMDLSVVKQIGIGGRFRGQFNLEFLNAFNLVQYENPNVDPTNANFGKVATQVNLPRDIQLGFKILW